MPGVIKRVHERGTEQKLFGVRELHEFLMEIHCHALPMLLHILQHVL